MKVIAKIKAYIEGLFKMDENIDSGNQNTLDLHDRPINNESDDLLAMGEQIVNKIYHQLQGNVISPLTIAITGEWGIGKTSSINLLRKKLEEDSNNIVIYFEPLLEGKFEIFDMIESFYLKLYAKIPNEGGVNNIIRKSLKSLGLLVRSKISVSASLPCFGDGKIDYDLGKNIDDLLNLWRENQSKPLSNQIRELGNALKSSGYKLYIIIDEIDRLSSKYIVNFLLFARILEDLDDLICLMGMDYEKVIDKLMLEKELGFCDYISAKDYLDKLFQAKFPIHVNTDKLIEYSIAKLTIIDNDKFLSDIITSNEYEVQKKLSMVIEYLATPRQIKKWLISIKINYEIIKYIPNKLEFLAFTSTAIKHPILIENISKNTIPLLYKKGIYFSMYIKDKYGVDIDKKESTDNIILLSSGILTTNNTDDPFKKLFEGKIKHFISEHLTTNFVNEFLKNTPVYLIVLFIQGYASKEKVSVFNNFFSGDINITLQELLENSMLANTLAYDLSDSLRKNPVSPQKIPSIDLLNRLWLEKVGDSIGSINPYSHILLFAIGNIDMDELIDGADLSISERHIERILSICNIKNEGGEFKLGNFQKPMDEQVLVGANVKNTHINSIGCIESILNRWIKSVAKMLLDQLATCSHRKDLIKIFYRYVQWGEALKLDNRCNLSSAISSFLQGSSEIKYKKQIIELITEECERYSKPLIKNSHKTPLEYLFNNDDKLIECINDFSNQNAVKYIESFKKMAATV